jgi:hypothetical protein
MTCIIEEPLHLHVNSSVAALLKPAARSRDVWTNSDVLMIREEQRSNAEQMKTITPRKPPIIHQPMAFHQITCHPCSKDHHRYTLRFMSCHHHLPRLQDRRSIQAMTGSVRETVSIIHPRPHLQLESLNVLREKWMSMRIMTMMEKRIRRVVFCQQQARDQGLRQEMQKLRLPLV